jgi:hypothetical protein
VYEGGWIYGRTSAGAKLTTLAHRRWLAFEVDEVRGVFDGASVVVQGSFHRVAVSARPTAPGYAAGSVSVKVLPTPPRSRP